ncbi:MAG: hypothetical protein IPO85_17025 [Saprospiraceae bacterium]|uniref:Uncharacterized protein n=1 Tax=Candidatus Defluviibacterium haderslevense TaxID=2981993 RepID=A0A9D7XEK1_9BACT|nr:hypothetical protein [Candidatus Defluviibacterium haderslevense]
MAGATSVRATSDTTFTIGMTATSDFPEVAEVFFTYNFADTSYNGGSEFYIAKFNNIN